MQFCYAFDKKNNAYRISKIANYHNMSIDLISVIPEWDI